MTSATPEEDYDYYEEENFDHFMEDEEALEALREVADRAEVGRGVLVNRREARCHRTANTSRHKPPHHRV